MADETLTDEALLTLVAAGDSAAISKFYDRWFPQFARLATRLTSDKETGEDLAQEAVVKVIMGAGKYQPGRSPRSWLLAILYHLVQDWARRKKVRKATSLSDTHEGNDGSESSIDIEGREPTAQERAEARERADAVRDALTKISIEDREVLILRDYEGLSAPETAQILGISVEKVGSRLFRARQRFGALLVANWPDLFSSREK
jgi:RNA polymerase sigma-70 factor (ECF subfamily)